MRAYEIRDFIGPDGLVINRERPMPEPAPDEVLVRMRAASLNFRDTLVAGGGRGTRPNLVPLSDGAGEVVAVGAAVRAFKPGDRVAGTFFRDWEDGAPTPAAMNSALGGALDGVLAEHVVFPEHGLVHIPEHLSFAEGATLPCAGVTAWHALAEVAQVRAGDTVLLLGTGGVSIFALQFAKLHGATVIITSSSDEKLARAKALGADHLINYRTRPDWDDAAREITGGPGVDLVVEVGGPGTLEHSLAAARLGGTVALIGVLTGPAQINPLLVLQKSIRLTGIYVGSRAMFQRMNRAIAANALRPVIDRSFDFEAAPDAWRHMTAAGHFGKLVITV